MSSKVDQKRKKQKVSLDSPLNTKWFNKDQSSKIRKEHDASGPYKHTVLEELCQDDRMRKIHDELTHNMKANFKETDLFKVFQTADLAALDSDLEKKMPHLLSMRKAIYSSEFREFVTEITGCGDLTDRVDCSCNAYAHSCHLLCHDDVIGTRRVSYIIYLSDPDDPWQVIDGGAVELYPLLESSVVKGSGDDNRQGIPENVPTKALLPTFNTMLIFAVQPGRSYHSVQEVFSSTKPRLSISGWYHATTAPEGSDKSSLKQIMTLGDDHRLFTTFPSAANTEEVQVPVLSKKEIKQLSQWINPNYLTTAAMKDINEQFCANSSLQLNDFIRSDAAYKLTQALIAADHAQHCGHGAPQLNYSVGRSAHWELVGPPHKRRHLLYNTDTPSSPSDAPSTDDRKLSDQVGKQLDAIRREVFRSPVFAKYLQVITELQPLAHRDEVRRFRPGLDYTVAHYGVLTKEVRLDATLCFVNDDKEIQDRVLSGDSENPDSAAKVVEQSAQKPTATGKSKPAQESDDEEEDSSADEEEGSEEEEEDAEMGYDEVWDGGEVGGFECYIEAEEDPENAEAAEVYRSSYGKEKTKGESCCCIVNFVR